MSSQKKPSFWQQLKYLLTAEIKLIKGRVNSMSEDIKRSAQKETNTKPAMTKVARSEDGDENQFVVTNGANTLEPHKVEPHKDEQRLFAAKNQQSFDAQSKGQPGKSHQLDTKDAIKPKVEKSKVEDYYSSRHKKENDNSEAPSKETSAKFISLSSLDQSDNMALLSATYPDSDNPITDSILDYLEANELNYHYHEPTLESDSDGLEQDPADVPSGNQTQKYDGSVRQRNVHHISMAMRYYQDSGNDEAADNDIQYFSPNSDLNPQSTKTESTQTESSQDEGEIEWGCVIRIHEHTQLVAFYGILPIHLPESHMQAGMVLATQLNYDMMLGCVEIDIRDGEIRFKNSLDFEPIINTNNGVVPPTVISYLLKGVMAMTASFAPLFSDLIASDPKDFELDTLLDELNKAQMDKTFYLPTRMIQ
ncbi:hypothetical protein [Psychrobacter sp.]|uniref:hypothetical protein n=1 Tax=Psychrobacter sp. TaxID=56811 RepID=UPI0025E7CEBF|nr:hypothetical protein [Psychrobacter sp.]